MQPKDLLIKALPWIGAAATGNVPGLIALAAQTVGEALGTKVDAHPEAIAAAVAGATPDQMVELKKTELDFQARMQEAGYKEAEDLRHTELETSKLFVQDTSDARHVWQQDRGVFWLGISVLATFAVVMGLSVFGAFRLLVDDDLKMVDPGIVAAVFGFLGTAIGYVAANAQQVISFFFGSSRGSQENHRAMADVVRSLGGTQKVQGS